MPASTSTQSLSEIFPARRSSQIFPGVRARAQRLALPVAAQHRPGRQIDRRQVHAGGAEQQARRGLVATAHQHDAVDGMAAQQFLGVHRQHVAVEHRGRLQKRFRQRQRRQLHRKTARHQDAALDVVDAALEMHVAGLRVRPGVEDRDDRAGPSTPPARSPSASRASGGRRRGDRRARTSARCGGRRGSCSWFMTGCPISGRCCARWCGRSGSRRSGR